MKRLLPILGILICTTLTVEANTPPPNILLIIADDQAWTDFGFMGHPVIKTPHLDRLANEGLVFTHGYVPSSLCRPSLATLATGLYPHQHKITGNDPPGGPAQRRAANAEWIELFKTSPPVAGMLAARGYVSHQSGKWWEGPCQCGAFTGGMTHGDPERGGRHGDDGLAIGRETMQPIYEFIEDAAESPFFVWYAPFLPHTPHNPPERLLAQYQAPNRPLELAKYYAMCAWLDETVGELMAYLHEHGHAENTLVLFISDNGWVQPLEGQEGWGTSYGAPRGKRSPYDGGLRTPIIVHWPGRVRPNRVDVPVSSIDIVPTILAAANLPIPGTLPGVNLLDRAAVDARDIIFGAIFAHDAVDIHRPETSLLYRWCVQFPWKLIVPHEPNTGPDEAPELYNLLEDPQETQNLARLRPDRVVTLRQRINHWWPVAEGEGP